MDLLEILKQKTETKTPSVAASQSWDFSTDDKQDVVAPVGVNTHQKQPQTTTTAPSNTTQSGEPKPDKKTIRMDAEASQAGIEFLTTLIGEFIITWMYYKKFTAEQRELINEKLLDSNQAKFTDEEKALLHRYQRLMKEKDRKMKKMEQSDKAKERMINAFERYSEITGKTFMSPGLMLTVAISENVVKTITSVAFD